MNDIAVLTATIGRPDLDQAIQSVMNQTVPATHYVFVDGKHNWDAADAVLYKYPDIQKLEFPFHVGADAYRCSPFFCGMPWMIKEKYIAFLDDDNWFEPNHLESCINLMERYDLDVVFSLRNIVDADGNFICEDDAISLGYHPNFASMPLADTSTIVVKRDIARKYGYSWYAPEHMDQHFTIEILKHKLKIGMTGLHTLNYRLSHNSLNRMDLDWRKKVMNDMRNIFPEMPWRKESVIKYKEQS